MSIFHRPTGALAYPSLAILSLEGFPLVLKGAGVSMLARPCLTGLRLMGMSRIYLDAQAIVGLTPFSGIEISYQRLLFKRLGVPAGLWILILLEASRVRDNSGRSE